MVGKKHKSALIIPVNLFFYVIPLTLTEQWLTKAELRNHYPEPKGWKVYMGNHYEFVAFENGITIVSTYLNDQSQNSLYLHVERTSCM